MFLISLVSVLVLAGMGSAADYTWDGDSPYSVLFVDPCNWDPLAPYGPDDCDDTAYIPSAGANPTVVITAPTVREIRGPAWNSNSDHEILLVQDANLTTCEHWRVEDTGDGTAYITLVDRARVEVGKRFYAHGDDQKAVISLYDDSVFIVNRDLRCGDDDADYFELNMTDNAYMYAGNDDDGFRQNDGEAHADIGGNAVFECEYWRWRMRSEEDFDNTITIKEDATVNVLDDHMQLSGGGTDLLMTVTDNAILNIDRDLIFGEDNSFTANATLDMPCGSNPYITVNDDLKFYDDEPDNPGAFIQVWLHGGTLDCGGFDERFEEGKYDWNIDICCNGVWIIDGDQTAMIAEHVETGRITICGYYEGCGSPYELVVDYNSNDNETTVSVEHDPYQVYDPDPVCCTDPDAEDVLPELCLSWTAGDSPCPPPITFFVFLSTDYDKVASGDLSVLVCYDTEANECCVEDLCLGETYYWRVDAVCECYTAEGDIWCFKVVDCLVFDDFEAYDNSCDPETALYETWLDGAGDCNGQGGNGTGSTVFSATDPDPGQEDKVMEYFYNSTGSEREFPYSEAQQPLDSPLDLTDDCEALLRIWFYGDPDNTTESMWVVLSDGTNDGQVTYGTIGPDSPDDIKNAEWRDFIVDLQDFADAGVDMSAVTEIAIGFGERGRVGEFPGDPVGVVYFDDITFCATTCIPRYARDGDIDDDCDVDWDDVDLMAGDWLEESDNYGYCPK
jgi:hypothetical protein